MYNAGNEDMLNKSGVFPKKPKKQRKQSNLEKEEYYNLKASKRKKIIKVKTNQ